MIYEEFASDLDLRRTITFASPEENQEVMQRHGVNQEMRQLGKGRYRCDLAVRSTEEAEFFSDRFGKAFSMRLEPPEGMIALMLLRSPAGPILASGDHANESLLVVPPKSGTDIVSPDLSASDAIILPFAHFTESMERLCPTLSSIPPEDATTLRGDTSTLQALGKAIVHLTANPNHEVSSEDYSHL
jgi:hypothetical protein